MSNPTPQQNKCCEKCKGFMEKTRFTLSCMECHCHQSEKYPVDVLVGFNPNFNYSHHSHRHCFSYGDKQPPCGIKLEDHKQCCLCDLKVPSSEKPQPENWEKEMMDKFCVMFERAGDDKMVEGLESFIRSLLSRQKEQMLEALRGCVALSEESYTLDQKKWVTAYNDALSDVEEKIKAL